MLRWLKSLFAWKDVRDSGVWIYSENAVTGQRKAYRHGGCYQPLDYSFLRPGDKVVDHRGVLIVGRSLPGDWDHPRPAPPAGYPVPPSRNA
jgi:hypothetical protein